MLEPCRDVNLRKEPLGAEYCGKLRMYDLDCDLPRVTQILGKIDRCHPALTQLALNTILAGKSRRQSGNRVISHLDCHSGLGHYLYKVVQHTAPARFKP